MPPARATDRPPPPARRPVAARPAPPTPRSGSFLTGTRYCGSLDSDERRACSCARAQRSLLAEHASPADRASADTSELPTAALFRRSGRITVESRACLVVLKLASLLGRREDSRAPTSPSDATRSWSTARSASAGTPGSPIRCPHPPRRRLQALPAERGGPGHTDPIRGMRVSLSDAHVCIHGLGERPSNSER